MATNQPPSVEESLAEPHRPKIGSRLAKNLHIIIPGILVAALAAVLFTDAAEQDEAAGPRTLAEKAAAEINETSRLNMAGEQAAIDAELQRQRQTPITPPDNGLPPIPAIPSSLGAGPAPMPAPIPRAPQVDEDARAAELARQKREEEIRSAGLMALGGGTGARGKAAAGSTGSAGADANPADEVRRRIESQAGKAKQMQEELLGSLRKTAASAKQATPGIRSAGGSDNAAWLDGLGERSGQRDVITLDPAGPEPVIHQGAVIPSVLITELNSDLPGQLTAMVTMDVYDTVRGDHMLIPKGSKLVGTYNNSLTAGQERVMAAFTRIIRPDGSSIDLRAMQAADGMGQAGLADEVDNHFFKMFSTSFLIAGLAYLFETNNQPDTVVVTGQGTGQGLGSEAGKILVDVSRTVLDRYKVIPPTIHIRKGHKFNVVVNRDMAIPAYH